MSLQRYLTDHDSEFYKHINNIDFSTAQLLKDIQKNLVNDTKLGFIVADDSRFEYTVTRGKTVFQLIVNLDIFTDLRDMKDTGKLIDIKELVNTLLINIDHTISFIENTENSILDTDNIRHLYFLFTLNKIAISYIKYITPEGEVVQLYPEFSTDSVERLFEDFDNNLKTIMLDSTLMDI